jgi:hypothetical protein
MRRRGGPGLLVLLYIIIGAFVAGIYKYFRDVGDIEGIVSALLAIFLWPLVLLGVDSSCSASLCYDPQRKPPLRGSALRGPAANDL